MEVSEIKNKIKVLKENSKKRNFTQTFDLIMNLKNMDLKKPEHKIDVGVSIKSELKPKKLKVCAIIEHDVVGADKVFDKVIYQDELLKLKGDMDLTRKITQNFDKFVVQASIMPKFAQILGRYLGPLNKMPSPKLGMVITPKSDLTTLAKKIQTTVHIQTKKNLVLQVSVGSEKESDDIIVENIKLVYDALMHAVPNQENNIKNVQLKLTMSKSEVL